MKPLFIILVILAALVLAGCDMRSHVHTDRVKLERVFRNTDDWYTLMYSDPATHEVKTIEVYRNLKIFSDAEKGQSMWADIEFDGNYALGGTLHIHSASQVSGGSSSDEDGNITRKVPIE